MTEQTYEISMQDGFRLFCENEEFRKALSTGSFIHCENRFVINHPKYVTINSEGRPALTEHAKTHNDECCLIFSFVAINEDEK